jgi:hypothetical protein
MENDNYTTSDAEVLDEVAKLIHGISGLLYDRTHIDMMYPDSIEAQMVKKEVALLLSNLHARGLYDGERKFRIQYTEVGHGKMIKGKRYDGKKTALMHAVSAEVALARLHQSYSPGAIKSIDEVETVVE